MSSCNCKKRNHNCVSFSDSDRLPVNICLCYKSITSDGCNYYVTLPELRKVAVFNRKFRLRGMIDVNNKYDNLTYDPNENVFYATIQGNNRCIVKLDRNFNKLAMIPLSIPEIGCQTICSLSFNCQTNRLVLVLAGSIVEVNKDGTFGCKIVSPGSHSICYAISVAPYYITIINRGGKQYVKVFDANSCCESCEVKVPKDFMLLSLALRIGSCSKEVKLVALATKDGRCNYLIKLKLKDLCINDCNRLHCCRRSICSGRETERPVQLSQPTSCPTPIDNETIESIMDRPNCPYRD